MSRKTEELHPTVAERLARLRQLAGARGLGFIVTCTLRTREEQMALFAQGRKPVDEVNRLRSEAGLPAIGARANNRIVTRALTSVHQFGLAFDIALADAEGRPVWSTRADLNDNGVADYEELGALGEEAGLAWGGRFKFRDYCHFEYRGGLSMAELKDGKRPA